MSLLESHHLNLGRVRVSVAASVLRESTTRLARRFERRQSRGASRSLGTYQSHILLGSEVTANGSSSLVLQATAVSLGTPPRGSVLRVPRVEGSNEGVRVQLGQSESRDHVEVVLFPMKVEDELDDGAKGGDRAGFDRVAD